MRSQKQNLPGKSLGLRFACIGNSGPASWNQKLTLRHVPFRSQVELPVEYKGCRLDCGYRIDLLVDNRVVVELKSVERILSIHEAQLITYLRLSGIHVGLLINFNVPVLRRGIVRRIL